MSRRSRATTDPRTITSIERGKSRRCALSVGWVTLYDCGCDERLEKDYLYLCRYHEGFSDALDIAGGTP